MEEQNCYDCETIFRPLLCTCNHGAQICSQFFFTTVLSVLGGLVCCDAAYDCVCFYLWVNYFLYSSKQCCTLPSDWSVSFARCHHTSEKKSVVKEDLIHRCLVNCMVAIRPVWLLIQVLVKFCSTHWNPYINHICVPGDLYTCQGLTAWENQLKLEQKTLKLRGIWLQILCIAETKEGEPARRFQFVWNQQSAQSFLLICSQTKDCRYNTIWNHVKAEGLKIFCT
jgi:hypothetical protein